MQWNLWQSDINFFFFFLYNSMCLYGPGYYSKLCEFTVSLVIYDSSLYFCLGMFILMYRWTDAHRNTNTKIMEYVGLGIFSLFFFFLCLASSSQFSLLLCSLNLLHFPLFPSFTISVLLLPYIYLTFFQTDIYNWTKNAQKYIFEKNVIAMWSLSSPTHADVLISLFGCVEKQKKVQSMKKKMSKRFYFHIGLILWLQLLVWGLHDVLLVLCRFTHHL